LLSLSCITFAQPFYPACAQLLDAVARIEASGTDLKGQFSPVVPRFEDDLLFLATVRQKLWRRMAEFADPYKWRVR
jgi:hypothetical protein